jgi:DNA-entry nuclease
MRIQRPKPGKLPKWVKIAIYLIVAIVVVRGELKDVGILPSGSERDYSAVEEYADKPYVEMNGNKPEFDELTTKCFEEYSKLDSLGRCGVAYACVGLEIMPTEERGA